MGRSPCCDKVGLKKGPWTPEEDQKLLAYIQEHGHGSWRALPPKAGLQRCGKSCRLRWTNYLRPDIKRGKFSLQEEQTIIQLHALLGNRWSAIAGHLPKRTDNEIKNYWNTHLKKRLAKMGIDPTTHKPKNHALGSGQPKDIANLSHMAQWESARLEAEARIVRESKLVSSSYHSQLLTKAAAAGLPPPPPQRPPCLDILKVWQGAWMSKPRKDNIATPTANGFFSSNGTLESPTSILNFSDNNNNNNVMTVPQIGSIQETPFPTADSINYVGNPSVACTQDQQMKGIMENSTTLHDIVEANSSSTYVVGDHGLRFPSFLEGYTDLTTSSIACSTATVGPTDQNIVFEDNKISYWTNILNNSMMDSSVF